MSTHDGDLRTNKRRPLPRVPLPPTKPQNSGDAQGRLLSDREPLFRIGQALAALGIDLSDLVYD